MNHVHPKDAMCPNRVTVHINPLCLRWTDHEMYQKLGYIRNPYFLGEMNNHTEPKFLNNDDEAAVYNANPKSPKTGATKEPQQNPNNRHIRSS